MNQMQAPQQVLRHNQRLAKLTGGEFLNLTARVLVKWSEIRPVCGKIVVKRKITANLAVIFLEMVDSKGIEPSTSAMRTNQKLCFVLIFSCFQRFQLE